MSLYQRFYPLEFVDRQTLILLGPRKTGKTTFLKQRFPKSLYIDLLQSEIVRNTLLTRASAPRAFAY